MNADCTGDRQRAMEDRALAVPAQIDTLAELCDLIRSANEVRPTAPVTVELRPCCRVGSSSPSRSLISGCCSWWRVTATAGASRVEARRGFSSTRYRSRFIAHHGHFLAQWD